MNTYKSLPTGRVSRLSSQARSQVSRVLKLRSRTLVRSVDEPCGELPPFPSAPERSYEDLNLEDLSEDMIWSLHASEALNTSHSSSSARVQMEDWRTFRARMVAVEKRGCVGNVTNKAPNSQVSSKMSSKSVASKPGAGTTSQAVDSSDGHSSGAIRTAPQATSSSATSSSTSASASSASASAPYRQGSRGQRGRKFNSSARVEAAPGPPTNCPARRPAASAATECVQRPKLRLGPGSWAHDLAVVEPGCLLLATGDNMQFFNEAVVLITSHDEVRGTIGFVLNKPSPLRVHELQVTGISEGFGAVFSSQRLSLGGPVHLDHITLLHKFAGLASSHKITDQLYSGGLVDAMKLIQAGLAKPYDFTLALGMSAWGARQLNTEIERGCWRVVASSHDLVLPRRIATPSDEQDERDSCSMYHRILSAVDGV